MDLDLACVSAIITEGPDALKYAQSKGLRPERLQGEAAVALAFLLDYIRNPKYGWPTAEFLGGRTQIFLETPPKAAHYLVDEVLHRNLYVRIQRGLEEAGGHLQKIQANDAYYSLEKLLTEIRAEQAVSSNVESIFKLGPEIRTYYERIKSGERGIQTLWPTINEMTFGFWPEDLVLFAARIGVGKTWTAILLALHAWKTPKAKTGERCRVLFITTEVSQTRVGMRLYSALERLPYGEFTHGRMSFIAEERFYKAAQELLDAEGFYVTGGDFDFRIESVEQAIENCKPDIVVIDGAYLLQAEGPNRTERMASIFNDMKRLAKRRKVCIVITTQLNRGSKKGQTDTVELDAIALSDVGGWNADLVFGLIQTDDNRKDKQMTIKPLKVREGAGNQFVVNWNFERMDFSELVATGGGGGDADEKGTGLQSDDSDLDATDDMPF